MNIYIYIYLFVDNINSHYYKNIFRTKIANFFLIYGKDKLYQKFFCITLNILAIFIKENSF